VPFQADEMMPQQTLSFQFLGNHFIDGDADLSAEPALYNRNQPKCLLHCLRVSFFIKNPQNQT
jgi:hypothetical protein